MAVLNSPFIGFIVIFIAALLLFGEMLVKSKGIFGLLGAGLFLLYFIYHLHRGSPLLMLGLLIFGLVLIIIDSKLITNGSVALIGVTLMILACVLPTPSALYGLAVAAAFILGTSCSFLFLKIFPARSYWSKLTFSDQLSSEAGYNAMNESHKALVGKDGTTETSFRPVGIVEIEGKRYSAITDGIWLKKGEAVSVISVDGTKIVVQKKAAGT
ncbi:membrane-bound ClpP family serine protease [Scopulibacillus daqui]|uniref:Membrane-bound ClpP family serine protease n=1 Tax=Scopulibacillus daqui TaxID=1469162 RepID=A0ABS2Q2L2_9BACL|nr:NfeD family protein [Scopulibacillus daqui]MBM7645772.1 membrane-bound ClpP family serine protease [Scopulibacillus daqui]